MRVQTANVNLYTNVDLTRASTIAKDFQAHYDALAETVFDCKVPGLYGPVDVAIFDRTDDYHEFAPPNTDAVIEGSKNGLAEIRPQVLIRRVDDVAAMREPYVREAVLDLVSQCYPELPPWLHEGLSSFYETAYLSDEGLVLGAPVYRFAHLADISAIAPLTKPTITIVPKGVVPPIDQLLSFGFDQFYQNIGSLWASDQPEEVEALGRYAGAWALVHALKTVDLTTRERLRRFMTEIRFGDVSPTKAWSETMQGIDIAALYREWTDPRIRYPEFEIAHTPRRVRAPTVTPFDRDAVLVFKAARRNWSSEEGRAQALEALEEAVTFDPDSAEPHLLIAAIREVEGDGEGARAALSQAIRIAPDEPSVLRAELYLLGKDPSASLPDGRSAADVASALQTRAVTADQYDALARYYLRNSDLGEARYWAARALRRSPTCLRCRVTAGDMLAAGDQWRLAEYMYKRALNQAASDPGFDVAVLQKKIREAKARQMGATTASPPEPPQAP